MLIEVGHFALTLALGLSLVQFAVPPWGTRHQKAMNVAGPTALAVFACGAVVRGPHAADVTSDFSVLNVVENSHSAKPSSTSCPASGGTMRARCSSGS